MSVWIGRWFSYLLSLSIVTVVLVYILDLPTFLSNAPKLVEEYYYGSPVKSFILDIFLIAMYISAGMITANTLNIKGDDHAGQLGSLALASGIISSAFMFLFLAQKGSSFFARWFKAAGFRAVIYDIILVCSVYVVMIQLHNKIF
ncbi:MAG: hypothetical protein CMB96_00205 [Flavobacteriaceae bacterium]|nr:hypothetical protein [Flavobacteriaceae bacterium]|tara:strand:- start:414 stop:848 length:435 start_codon:yes stop_codon:yes gene_type:complete